MIQQKATNLFKQLDNNNKPPTNIINLTNQLTIFQNIFIIISLILERENITSSYSQFKRTSKQLITSQSTNTLNKMADPILQFRHWYHRKYIISKLYFTFSLLMFIFLYFNLWIDINNIYLTSKLVFQDGEICRLFTSLFYQDGYSLFIYPFKLYISFTIIVNMQQKIYTKQTPRSYADFIWLLFVTFIWVTSLSLLCEFYFTNHFFFMCLCFLWYHKKPNSASKIFFGLEMNISYLCISYMIYVWVMGQHNYWLQILLAIIWGYVYYYLKVYSMSHYGKDYFTAPGLVLRLVEKYLVVEQRLGLVKVVGNNEEQDNNDPYGQYGYYENSDR